MLSNKHKYTLLRVSRLLLAPLYSLLALFVKKNENIIITSILNLEYSDNAKALFEILIKYPDFKNRAFFVINDKQKREELNRQYPGHFISNKGIKNICLILKSHYWFCSAMELPLPTLFQKNIRQVIHLGHGMLYKKVGVAETNANWYKKLYYALITSNITYTIATSPFCKKDISLGFGLPMKRVLITPQPKTYQIAFPLKIENAILTDKKNLNILYAPTWRPYAAVELFPFADLDLEEFSRFLSENNIHIWLRVHPRFEQDIPNEILNNFNIHLFSANNYLDINHYLNYFQGLITDYSSIYYDFLTLERPVLFFDYDLAIYNKKVGVIDRYKQVKPVETTKSLDHFLEQLLAIKNKTYDLSRIKEINKLVNYEIKNEKIAEEVLQKIKLI